MKFQEGCPLVTPEGNCGKNLEFAHEGSLKWGTVEVECLAARNLEKQRKCYQYVRKFFPKLVTIYSFETIKK